MNTSNLTPIEQLADICGSSSDNRHDGLTTYEFDKKALEALRQAIILDMVSKLEPSLFVSYKTMQNFGKAYGFTECSYIEQGNKRFALYDLSAFKEPK